MKGNSPAPFHVPNVAQLDADIGEKYNVRALIGAGGMGAVFQASQPGLERDVAIKILPSGIDPDAFTEESRILARCNHPNIVSVFEYGQTASGIPYIVTEFVEGQTLGDFLKNGNLSNHDYFPLLRQICDGLAYAHSRGMVHMDIKPGNILIDGAGQVKLVDFGVARMIGDQPTGGTPGFAAPEVMSGMANVDPSADIYSLGVVIYWMLTGGMPGDSRQHPSSLNRKVESGFDRITEFSLKENPSMRYQNIAELEADLMDLYFSLPPTGDAKETVDRYPLRTRLVFVFLSMFISQIVGSIFNIQYNNEYIIPRFFQDDPSRFKEAVNWYNACAYLPLTFLWGYLVFSLRRIPESMARRRVINLPWWALGIAAVGWIGTIPGLWLPLRSEGTEFLLQLSISVVIGAAMAITQGFFVVDLLSQRLLYREYFGRDEAPWEVKGAWSLSLSGRGVFWTFSAGVCPVVALFLLSSEENRIFAGWVGLVCIVFGIAGGWLLVRLIVDPLNELRDAARAVGGGDLEIRVQCLRADELGVLGGQFNQMVAGLREREYIRHKFGTSHSSDTMSEMLHRPLQQSGTEKEVVVLTVFLADFDSIVTRLDPDAALSLVTECETIFLEATERRGGVSQSEKAPCLTAVFGIDTPTKMAQNYAKSAAEVLREDLEKKLSSTGIRIGIAVETGTAIVGTVQSGRVREIRILGDVCEKARLASRRAAEEAGIEI